MHVESKSVPFLFVLVLLSTEFCAAPRAEAADLFLADEPEVHAAIDKLNALGFFPRFLANTRPYSVRAVRAAAGPGFSVPPAGGFELELYRWLSAYAAPKQMGRLTAAGAFSDGRFVPPNSDGIPVPRGWSGKASLSAREETTEFVSGQVRFASFFGEGGDEGNRLLDASVEVGYPYAAVQAGKISAWYGPGRRGALILTNNAEPYPGVRIRNPVPIVPKGRLSFLGAFQYELFAARMEKKPQYSHSFLVGTRLAFRPAGWLEIGFSQANHYGGDGRDESLGDFLEDYFGSNHPPDRGNSLSGYDIALTLPLGYQPVQAYWERAGEDNNRLGRMFVPWSDLWGNVLGLYFPRVLGFSRCDLRVEYADNYSGEAKDDNWYGHSAYPHRYRGQILGHPMGGSSRDWFVGSRYHMRPDAFADVAWEQVLHDGADARGERRTVVSAGLTGWLTASVRGEARLSYERVTDEGGAPGPGGTDFSAILALSWQLNRLVPPDVEDVPLREYQGTMQ